jgi:hypothetical protein
MPDARPRWVDDKDPCRDRAGQAMPGGTWRSAVRIAKLRAGYDHGHDQPGSAQASPAVSYPDLVGPDRIKG